MIRVQGVVVGDYGVGKTGLVYALLGKDIPQDHIPTLMESHCLQLDVKDGCELELVLFDTPGSEDYLKLTQMGLTGKDIVMLCFSLVDLHSYENITKRVRV